MPVNPILPHARQKDIIIQELPEETLLYDLRTHQAHCLNQSASLIWKHCDGRTTISEIRSILEQQLDSSFPDDLIHHAIDQLDKANLVSGGAAGRRTGWIGRRELIKRIGAGAAILVPVVISITAPEAAHAASCVANGQDCIPGISICCSTKKVCDPAGNSGKFKC